MTTIERTALTGVLLLMLAAPLHGWGQETEATPPADKCVVLLTVPEGTLVTVDGRGYETQRRFEFAPLTPGRKYESKVAVTLPDGNREQRTLTLSGGTIVRASFGAEQPVGEVAKAIWSAKWGIVYTALSPALDRDLRSGEKGLLITAVAAGSAADRAGLRPGDVVLGISGEEEVGKSVQLRYARQGDARTGTLTIGQHELSTSRFAARPPNATAKTVVVDPSGRGNTRTITAALLQCGSGGTVELRSGVYRERVVIPGGVTVRTAADSAVEWSADSCPVFVFGVADVTLEGLSLAGTNNAMEVLNSNRVTLRDCNLAAEAGPTLRCVSSKEIVVESCRIRGTEKANGVSLSASSAAVRSSVISACSAGIIANPESTLDAVENLFEGNLYAVLAFNSRLTARTNTVTGNGKGTGIYLKESKGEIVENTIRGQQYGVDLVQSESAVTGNSLLKNDYGLQMRGGTMTAKTNVIVDNRYHGLVLAQASSENQDDSALKSNAVIENNTISGNGTTAVVVAGGDAGIAFNLIEGNGYGINSTSGTIDVDHNTIVNNQWWGVRTAEKTTARIHHNVIAFNRLGVVVDVLSQTEANRNAVFGNLATRGSYLTDGNYARFDRMVLSTGHTVPVWIYPANDLRGSDDVNEEPKFVRAGEDYRPQADSPLVLDDGHIGAFAPVGAEGRASR